jgi:phytoene dehydrogenase-like protein
MTDRAYDIVVAGAGHNSLVTTAYLAKAGYSCLVIEARNDVGGDTATDQLTIPGYLHDSCSTAHNLIQSSPTLRDDELGLGEFGLEYLFPDPVVHIPFPDGTSITQWRDLDRTCAEFARFSQADGKAFRQMIEEYDQVKGAFSGFDYTPIGWGATLDERLAELPDGYRWQRIRQLSAAEVIMDRFEDPRSRAFMLWMAFMTLESPQGRGTGRLAFSLAFGRQRHSWVVPKGGSGALPQALAALIRSRGGEIITGSKVTGLILDGGRCVGVETEDGVSHRAGKAVLSTIHVKHLLEMAPRDRWGEQFAYGVDSWKAGVSMCAAHYATTEAPRFQTEDGDITPLASGMPTSVERMLQVGDDFERAVVALDDPVLLVLCPTVVDPSRAPEGAHTLKIVGFQPYGLPGGPEQWDELMPTVANANLEHLRRYAPNVTDESILATTTKSPLDLERMNAHNWHGSCHGGEQSMSQMGALRPAAGWATHRTPIDGLYQTGATTHPGGSVSAGPGRNAARVILSDLGSSLESVLAGTRDS